MKKLLALLLLSPLVVSEWNIKTEDDPIDGSWKYLLGISVDETKRMIVRKYNDKWEFALFPNDSFICGSYGSVKVIFKIDSNSTFTNRFEVSINNSSVYLREGTEFTFSYKKEDEFGKKILSKDKFWLGTSKEYMDFESFFNELSKADELFMRMTDSCGTRTDMRFVLDGFKNKINQL